MDISSSFVWGVSRPATLTSERRVRTLGLNSAVREFNELAVPGLGGVRFAKNIFLACLGIAVAEKARSKGKKVTNIQVTNAIEALACVVAYQGNDWSANERLRGRTKLSSKTDFAFKVVGGKHFYVTQPMRMSTVQILPDIGLVDSQGQRFNTYQLTQRGQQLIELCCEGSRPFRRSPLDYLTEWVLGDRNIDLRNSKLVSVLSPLTALPELARSFITTLFISGEGEQAIKRRNALAWIKTINGKEATDGEKTSWQQNTILSPTHFDDLNTGKAFFCLRDSALALLIELESMISKSHIGAFTLTDTFPLKLKEMAKQLKYQADQFLLLHQDPTTDKSATVFAQVCAHSNEVTVIQQLVERDGVILRLSENTIKKGAAFKEGLTQKENTVSIDDEQETQRYFPIGASFRLENLYALNLDLTGQSHALGEE